MELHLDLNGVLSDFLTPEAMNYLEALNVKMKICLIKKPLKEYYFIAIILTIIVITIQEFGILLFQMSQLVNY